MFSWLKNKKKNKEQDKQAQQEPQPQELESEESIEDSAPPVAAEEALPVEVAVPAVEPELETPAPIVEEEVVAVEQPIEPGPEPESGKGWLSRMTDGLSKSSSKITQGLTDLVTKKSWIRKRSIIWRIC